MKKGERGWHQLGSVKSSVPSFALFLPPSTLPFLPALVLLTVKHILMSNKTGLGPWIDGLGVLQSVAKAVPVLGAPVEGSIEAVKQILQYTQVGRVHCKAI
jgi:hypothetical protein